ncbi:undecaprenyl-phosphate galactose phosphotransferase WbaP [Klebsiella michiganensis]|uniref:undecaprenyl-phosphate galactose phosphotransferase WbaP n=1 Tax=Klebsiella michiganensis TaxID=1134687 RepID=UPI00178669E2|nr:undecaprenyl-phosphate galactose phosphotransferase WbaP [Klebsiella michiganensis]ELI8802183.1 undecaprenyl-phosphate galactose phosphotransferase WbaP [Klebsiella michiganensis]MBE0155465.1 undecaprenyl-phosphate galactose phosphotransferase WbaP [Klebsiella michiganensis]MBE0169826.1 undecaprenyl-phosphate galactose phosphotransferase WbaP [Klebsiella michiganensis]MBE0189752.1 undecaprenyl-phosphate galactose phosphotransferase WbaP [Klebsiella michiganensis]MBE0217784.1 undecaprenyl-ph
MTRLARNFWTSVLLALSDFIGFTLSIYIAIAFIKSFILNGEYLVQSGHIDDWITFHICMAICCVGWYSVRLRHYFYRKTFWFELKEILRTLVIFAVIEIAVMSFANWYFSRYVWCLTWILVLILVPSLRMLTKKFLDYMGLWKRDTIIIGDGDNAIEACKAINSETNLGFNVVSFISDGSKPSPRKEINNIPVEKVKPNELIKRFDKRTQFIVALESHEGNVRNDWLRVFMINGYRYVSVIPTLRGMPLDSTDMSFIFSHEVMIFRVHQNLAKMSSRIIKRLFDIVGSLSIIAISSPLLVYIALKVKQDNGPAIYGHERIGKGGKSFKCLKFRSMVVNSKEVLDHLLNADPNARAEWDATFKLKDDPRITNIGKFLRKTSLDELPQLFNVLKGEMSLVGPRPIITAELERYSDEVDYYLLSKPGMTGLWQVSGRSDVDYETRVYLDAWYVKNWSMWNDIAILFKTIGVVLRKDGAY